jgi:hypothetical protein
MLSHKRPHSLLDNPEELSPAPKKRSPIVVDQITDSSDLISFVKTNQVKRNLN